MGAGEIFENGVVVSPIKVVRQRNRIILSRAGRFVENHDSLRVWIRQRSQQHRIDDAEDSGVSADPERKRDNSDGGKRRVFDELPERETQITHTEEQPLDLHGWRDEQERSTMPLRPR